MKKRIVLFLLILGVCLTGCGKSVQLQISEQLELGEKYLAQGDYEQAIVIFNKVIELDPKIIEAYEKTAEAYIKQNNLEQAYSYVEQAFDVVDSLTEEEKSALDSDERVIEKLPDLCEQILRISLMDENASSQKYYETLKKQEPEKAESYASSVQKHSFKKTFRETYAENLRDLEGTLPEDLGREDFYRKMSWLPEMSELLHDSQLWQIAIKLNNGKYLMLTDSQYVYYGDMQDGMRTGWGIWATVDSTGRWYYAGEWEDDYPNGTGTYITTEQEKFTFALQGLWNHGIENGQMHLTVSEGESELFSFLYMVDDRGMPVSGERDPIDHGVVAHDYVALYRNGDEHFFCPLDNFPHCVFGLDGVDGGYMWNYEMGGYPAQ